MSESILVIEEQSTIRKHIIDIMEFMGYESINLAGAEGYADHFQDNNKISLVLLSSCGSSKALQHVFREIRIADAHVPIIQIIDPDNAPRFSQELETGCITKLQLPLRYTSLEHALQQVNMYRQQRHDDGDPRSMELFRSLGGSSESVKRVRRMVEKVANTDANVFIIGESCSGK